MKSTIFFMIYSTVLLSFSACSSDDTEELTENFRLVTTYLSYSESSNTYKKNVPFSGGTYTLEIKASPSVKWNAVVTEGDILTVSPQGEQQGDGEINVTVAPNDERIPNKKGIVHIQNNVNDTQYTVTFIQTEKQLIFPNGLEGQSEEDFYKGSSQWNVNYMLEGEDIAILWDRKFGKNPKVGNPVVSRRFDPGMLMKAAQDAYNFIRQELKFATKPSTRADECKFLLLVRNDDQTSAVGGGYGNVPVLWLSPAHAHDSFDPNFKYVYHELCHCFQSIAHYDGASKLKAVGKDNVSSFAEMTSQWVLLRRYPDWMHQEPNHFNDYMKHTHLALGHVENAYCNPYILEYWATKRGVDFIAHIWQNASEADGGNFIKAYKRLSAIGQETFNEEIYEAASRFVTWDLPHIDKEYNKYGAGNAHLCELVKGQDKRYQISGICCPQNYGYNAICLKNFKPDAEISIDFEGILDNKDFNIKRKEEAEWHWGFVASLKDGTRVYSNKTGVGTSGGLSFKVPANTKYLWLVVAATPKSYWNEFGNEWPYQFLLTGAEPDSDKCIIR